MAQRPDFSKVYGYGFGFGFRREAFGGVLYHYEGRRPDPRVTFVDSPFLVDLLEHVPQGPLEALLSAVQEQFALNAAEQARVESYLTGLIAQGALVEK